MWCPTPALTCRTLSLNGFFMSKGRTEYKKALLDAAKKRELGEELLKKHVLAESGEWYFTLTLPIDVIDSIVSLSETFGVKPSDLAKIWVSKGIDGEN